MPLFVSSIRNGGRRTERVTSAPAQRPPSPLAAPVRPKPKTPRLPSSARRRIKKSAVHPVDLRGLESELELIGSEPCTDAPSSVQERQDYVVTVAVLHALDLPNPCLIRTCPHPFIPVAAISANDSPTCELPANRHGANYTSWSRDACVAHHICSSAMNGICIVRAELLASCTRHAHTPTKVPIGAIDDIVLPVTPGRDLDLAQFVSVYRQQVVDAKPIRYFAGKIKIKIQIRIVQAQAHAQPKPPTNTLPVVLVSEPPPVVSSPPSATPVEASTIFQRPEPFLSLNFGDALQQKRKQLKATVAPELVNHATIKTEDDPLEAAKRLNDLRQRANDHLVMDKDVDVVKPVGEGVHAVVYHVRVRDRTGGEIVDAAMKEFRYNHNHSPDVHERVPPLTILRTFEKEYVVLSRLVSSPEGDDVHATVRLIGVMLAPRLALITEYCRDGSLASCMRSHAGWSRITLPTKLSIAQQIASALASLHRRGIIHRDIKPHNIMIDGLDTPTPRAKIGDMGSAVDVNTTVLPLREETGSSGYTAPEVFADAGYDHHADIWSLGIVLWELFTASVEPRLVNPFHGLSGDAVVVKAQQGERPELPVDDSGRLPRWLPPLLHKCWSLAPTLRPSAAEAAAVVANQCR